MKKINILMIGILFFISACEKQQNEFFLNSHDASLVALDYLLLSDNQYVLNLSQDDAAILGISEFDYKRILQEINNANDEILKHKNDACFIIANPEELHKNEQNIEMEYLRIKTKAEIEPIRVIRTSGQEVGYDSAMAPYEAKCVNFVCNGGSCLLPVYNVTTTALGQTYAGGGVGFIDVNSSYLVPIAASNTDVTVSFRISSTGGGICNWNFDDGK